MSKVKRLNYLGKDFWIVFRGYVSTLYHAFGYDAPRQSEICDCYGTMVRAKGTFWEWLIC